MENVLYRVSAFGNFDEIIPNPKDIMDLMIGLQNFEVIPTTIEEFSVQEKTSKSRMMFIGEKEKFEIAIRSERIDIEFNGDGNLSLKGMKHSNEVAFDILKVIFNKYKLIAYRVACFSRNLISDIPNGKYQDIQNKFVPHIKLIDEAAISRWKIEVCEEKVEIFGQSKEMVNNRVSLEQIEGSIIRCGEQKEVEGYLVTIDINTNGNTKRERFKLEEIKDFLEVANKNHITILEKIERDMNV